MLIKVSDFACCNAGEPWGLYAKWNKQSQRTNTVGVHLYEISDIVKLIETESRVVVTRG